MAQATHLSASHSAGHGPRHGHASATSRVRPHPPQPGSTLLYTVPLPQRPPPGTRNNRHFTANPAHTGPDAVQDLINLLARIAANGQAAPEFEARVRTRLFTRRPQVVDESRRTFGELLQLIASMMTVVDGPDDSTQPIKEALPLAGSAPTTTALLGLCLIAIALIIIGAVRNTLDVYRRDYPNAIRRMVDLQAALVEQLGAAGIGTVVQQAALRDHVRLSRDILERRGLDRHERRAEHRRTREEMGEDLLQGNVARARQFVQMFGDVLQEHARGTGLSGHVAVLVTVLQEQCDALESTKKERRQAAINTALTSGMGAGVAILTAGSGVEIPVNAATVAGQQAAPALVTAAERLGDGGGGVLAVTQAAQALNMLIKLIRQTRERQEIVETRQAVEDLGAHLPPRSHAVYQELSDQLLHHNNQMRTVAAVLSVSQFLLCATSVASLAGLTALATAPISGVCAGVTIVTSNLQGRLERAQATFEGARADAQAAARLEQDPAALCDEVARQGLQASLRRVGQRQVEAHEHMAQVLLWDSTLKTLRQLPEPPQPADGTRPLSRYAAHRLHEDIRLGNSQKSKVCLPGEIRRAGQLLREQHPPESLRRKPAEIVDTLYQQVLAHEYTPLLLLNPLFPSQLLSHVQARLKKLPDLHARQLLRSLDGRPIEQLHLKDLQGLTQADPRANQIFMEECSALLIKGLRHLSLFMRHDSQHTLEMLARAHQRYNAAPVRVTRL